MEGQIFEPRGGAAGWLSGYGFRSMDNTFGAQVLVNPDAFRPAGGPAVEELDLLYRWQWGKGEGIKVSDVFMNPGTAEIADEAEENEHTSNWSVAECYG